MPTVAIIGYSGHSFVVLDSLHRLGLHVDGYFELEKKLLDPYELPYLGADTPAAIDSCLSDAIFVAIGDNRLRRQVIEKVGSNCRFATVIDPFAVFSAKATVKPACYLAWGSSLGPLTEIGEGAIINTSAIIEHECRIGPYAHVAPGAVLAGNVSVGTGAFVGANSVIRQGVEIGDWATIGAGAVVVSHVPARTVVVGNPARQMPDREKKKS